MKNARIHLIYLAIIGFLAYQYWTKMQALNETVGSIEQFDKLLKFDTEVIEHTTRMIKNDIDKQVQGYPSPINISYLAYAQNMIKLSSDVKARIEKQKKEFISYLGGYDTKDTSKLVNRLSSRASRQFFTEQKINEVRELLTPFEQQLNFITKFDNNSRLKKLYIIPKLLKNETYWRSIKNKTAADALTQLELLQNQIELDKVPYLNELAELIGGKGAIICGPTYRISIAPKKASLLEGEQFKAEIYLAQYASIPNSDVSFWVNNRELTLKDGVAQFERTDKGLGKKTIRAEARIKNPLTGQTISQFGEFEYEVLPKCSRDCH